jgi:hypothetical protein
MNARKKLTRRLRILAKQTHGSDRYVLAEQSHGLTDAKVLRVLAEQSKP